MNKDKLYTRTYPWEHGEVVVVGNREGIQHDVEEVIECEFVFDCGELLDAHVLRSKPAEMIERDRYLLRIYAEHWGLNFDELTALDRDRLRRLREIDDDWNF